MAMSDSRLRGQGVTVGVRGRLGIAPS